MRKTNFSKVEKSLEEGLIKIKSQVLLDQADALKGDSKIPSKDFCHSIIKGLDHDLQKLDKKQASQINSGNVNLKKLIANPGELTPQDWKTVKEIKERLEKYKKELKDKIPYTSDDDIIETQRKKEGNHRLNISKKWLPLDTHGNP